MKIKISLSVCMLLILLSGIYYFKVYSSVKEINIDADYITYNTEEELSKAADIILYGSPRDDFEEREHVNKFMDDGSLGDTYTLTNFEVLAVIKNSTELTINKKDFFKVIEPIGLLQEIDGKKYLEFDSYKAMNKNIEYVIYLQYNGFNGYSIINMSNGKFDINDLNKEKYTGNDEHFILGKTIIEKYSKYLN